VLTSACGIRETAALRSNRFNPLLLTASTATAEDS
jgi:hypothetical protein